MECVLPPSVHNLIDMALEEDWGGGDVTTHLTLDAHASTRGKVVAKEPLVVSGTAVFSQVVQRVDSRSTTEIVVGDGALVMAGETIAFVEGRIRSILIAERVALNFLQRLCGVATLTREYVSRVPSECGTRITDTRKTTPGMRFLERQAVLDGGGINHRKDLSGGILIKENHVSAVGTIGQAVERCRKGAPHPLKVEVEVRNTIELKEAIDAQADIIMLDNMNTEEMRSATKMIAGRAFVEASGGITVDRIEEISRTGVDAISVGALTHSAPAADISFLLEDVKA